MISADENDIQSNVYPNPFAESFTLIIAGNTFDRYKVSLKDISGRTVSEEIIISAGTRVRFGEKLSPGIYFMELNSGVKHKFIKIEKM